MVLRSVASVIFLAPAVIVCLSGGTPVSAKSYRQRRDGQPAPTGHASGAHTAALTRTRTAPARGSKQACTSPRTHWPHAPSRSHTTLARTPARGRHLRFEHVGGFIEDDIDVVLVLLPLDLHGYRARHGSHAVEERSKAADSKTSWRRDWFLSLRKERQGRRGAEIGRRFETFRIEPEPWGRSFRSWLSPPQRSPGLSGGTLHVFPLLCARPLPPFVTHLAARARNFQRLQRGHRTNLARAR